MTIDTDTDPPRDAASARRCQIMLREQAGHVIIGLAGTVAPTGLTMPFSAALRTCTPPERGPLGTPDGS